MKKSVGVLSLLMIAGSIGSSRASDYLGTVADVVQIGNTAYFILRNGNFGFDSCTTGRTTIVLHTDITTTTGKAYLSSALVAKSTGFAVYVQGAGACTNSGTPNGAWSEPLYVFWVQ